ncbi:MULTISPECIES: hypothetical protein [Rhodobacterales]|uniref:Uncharacterized protein n=1 Tax=Neptunicoccus cionae TaxID=2035344 RepID=A0A916VTL4_9RHOB|nr:MULTISPECIES: hypothetical protein [Rhodobacterales]MDR6267265.1 hypothetical protein [Roseobacter sp. N2S]GGA31804.1 hypothetical protein GCM10011498_36260 [Amylibacter cionae]
MYSLDEFRTLKAGFRAKLKAPASNEPLICNLHECMNAPGAIEIRYADGTSVSHVAEACNVAAIVNSVDRLLSLPRSTVACEELSEVLLLRLDVLREYVRDLIPYETDTEAASEKLIRAWAGFLKHPRGFVLAHRCIVDWADFEETVALDNSAVIDFSELRSMRDKDREKDRFRNAPVRVSLPTVAELEEFFEVSCTRMKQAIVEYA